VERHTVYRHFPTEADLFGACSAHYFAAHPLPDLEPWRAIPDPTERLARALDDIYRFYEWTEPMFANVWRDLEFVDALRPGLAPFLGYLAQATEILATGFGGCGEPPGLLEAAIEHGLDFRTWRSLAARDCVTRTDAVRLVAALVQEAAAASPTRGSVSSK
jgi:AcrR family transcriptional regulator